MRPAFRRAAAMWIIIVALTIVVMPPAMSHHPGAELFGSQWGEDDQLQRINYRFQMSAWNPPNRTPQNPNGAEELEGEFRQRVVDGQTRWNLLNRRLSFNSLGSTANFVDPSDPCNQDAAQTNPEENSIAVFDWGSVPGCLACLARRAAAYNCPPPPQFGPRSRIEWFGIVFDDNASFDDDPEGGWHTMAFTPSPDDGDKFLGADSNEIDLWAAAAHEFGHVAGWWFDHYNQRRPTPDPDWQGNNAPICGENRPPGEESWHYFQTMCNLFPQQVRGRTLEKHDKKAFEDIYAPLSSVICTAIEQVNQGCDDDNGSITP